MHVACLSLLVQGGACEPPSDYSGPCGSMSFKSLGQSQLEDAVLKCRCYSHRHVLRRPRMLIVLPGVPVAV